MNISALTKGFILPTFEYEIITKKKGGGSSGTGVVGLKGDLKKYKPEDIDVIKIYVDWDKKKYKHRDKEIYAELIEKKISVELLGESNEKLNISVELLD